jgi:hypothetical protein
VATVPDTVPGLTAGMAALQSGFQLAYFDNLRLV